MLGVPSLPSLAIRRVRGERAAKAFDEEREGFTDGEDRDGREEEGRDGLAAGEGREAEEELEGIGSGLFGESGCSPWGSSPVRGVAPGSGRLGLAADTPAFALENGRNAGDSSSSSSSSSAEDTLLSLGAGLILPPEKRVRRGKARLWTNGTLAEDEDEDASEELESTCD
jgi:hypothetical protein